MSVLTDALALASFWDTLPIRSVVWDTFDQQLRSQLGPGAHIRYDMGGMLWRATVTLDKDLWAASKSLRARLWAMKKTGNYFLATDPLSAAPAADPTGAILGANNVTVYSVNDTTGELRLTGGPNGYVVDQGHMMHIDFGTPARRGLFSFDAAATFTAGTTAAFKVTPVPWVGIVAGNPVKLLRPSAVFAILPGTLRIGAVRRAIVEDHVFEMLQVLDA